MAEASEYQQRIQPPMPDYFKFDQIQKEEYLSQLGNFSQEQRAIFHKLCEIWEPEIEYQRFIDLAKNQFSFVQSHLSQLMEKLFNARCGLMKVTAAQREVVNKQIILCDRDSIRFFYYYIENEYFYSLYSEEKVFITNKFMENHDVIIPGDYIEFLSLADISDNLVNTFKNSVRIFLLKCENFDPIYVTPATIPHLIRLSREKIRVLLKSSQLLTFISKTMGLMESEITRDLKGSSNLFWNNLCRVLIENREEVADKRRHISPDYYPAVSLIYGYTRNGLDDAEKIRVDKQELKNELVSVCQSIEMHPEKYLNQQELNEFLAPGISRWPEFKETFHDQCVKMKNKTSLPIIVNLGNGYIHRDHIYLTFRMELKEASIELKQHYLSLMDDMLTSRREEGMTAFSTTDSFVNNIRDLLRERYPILSIFLDKPKIVSEGIMHWCKRRSSALSTEKVRSLLNKYFEEESTLKFIRVDKMLELYLISLFNQAYGRLPLLRKFILRVFGRYDSYLETFSGLPPGGGKVVKKSSSTTKKMASKEMSRSGHGRANISSAENYYHPPEGGGQRTKRPRKKHKEKDRQYSNREQNSAWQDFQQALKTKKE